MTDYDAVLFDNDGVLVTPPAAETQAGATRAAFRAVGVDAPDEGHVTEIVDGVTVERLHEVCRAYDLDVETFWDARERHDERSQLDAFRAGDRGCYDDLDAIADLPLPRGVVSNNHHSTVAFILDFFDLHGLFETHHGRPMTVESLRLKKPEPHYLDRALEELDRESALYVGDSASDVVAAERAGMDVAFVRRSHNQGVDLPTSPTHDLDSLSELSRVVA